MKTDFADGASLRVVHELLVVRYAAGVDDPLEPGLRLLVGQLEGSPDGAHGLRVVPQPTDETQIVSPRCFKLSHVP